MGPDRSTSVFRRNVIKKGAAISGVALLGKPVAARDPSPNGRFRAYFDTSVLGADFFEEGQQWRLTSGSKSGAEISCQTPHQRQQTTAFQGKKVSGSPQLATVHVLSAVFAEGDTVEIVDVREECRADELLAVFVSEV